MRKYSVRSLAALLVLGLAAISQAAPPRGIMQTSFHRGGYADCGCESRVFEPSCGCGEPVCCDPCCTPCCLQIIPNLVRRTGCVLHKLFQCNRCCDPCGIEVGCDVGCADCWHDAEYPGVPVPEAEEVPMSRNARAYQHWNMPRRTTAAMSRGSRSVVTQKRAGLRNASEETSVVKNKPSKKPATLPSRTASTARPLDNEELTVTDEQEEIVVKRTSYNEPAKRNSRVPHNPLRDE